MSCRNVVLATVGVLLGSGCLAGLGLGCPALADPPEGRRGDQRKTEIVFLYLLADWHACETGGDCTAFEAALQAFEQRVRQHPQDARARYWLGALYLRQGRTREALVEMEAALRHKARLFAQLDRERVLADVAAARRAVVGEAGPFQPTVWNGRAAPVPSPWSGGVQILAGSDSNPSLQDDGLILFTPAGEPQVGGEADTALGVRGGLTYRRSMRRGGAARDRDGWAMDFGFEGGYRAFQDFSDLDLGQGRGVAGLTWGQDPQGATGGRPASVPVAVGQGRWSLRLQAAATEVWLGGERYLSAVDGAVVVERRQDHGAASRLTVTLGHEDFRRGDRRRSGDTYALEVSHALPLGRRHLLRLSVLAGERAAAAAYDAVLLEGRAELALGLAPQWTLHLMAAYRADAYDGPASNLFHPADPMAPARRDTTGRGSATLVRQLPAGLQGFLRLEHTDRRSNVTRADGTGLDYQRTTAALGVGWSF